MSARASVARADDDDHGRSYQNPEGSACRCPGALGHEAWRVLRRRFESKDKLGRDPDGGCNIGSSLWGPLGPRLAFSPPMLRTILAVCGMVAGAGLLGASCVQPAACEGADGAVCPAHSTDATRDAPDGGEVIGEDREQLPIVSYKPEDFPFRTIVRDDGEGLAGGWQAARADLPFWHVVIPHWPQRWRCALTVELPLRTEKVGRISSSRAAELSVEIAEDTARAMDYDLPSTLFCTTFIANMGRLFKFRYPTIGAKVLR